MKSMMIILTGAAIILAAVHFSGPINKAPEIKQVTVESPQAASTNLHFVGHISPTVE